MLSFKFSFLALFFFYGSLVKTSVGYFDLKSPEVHYLDENSVVDHNPASQHRGFFEPDVQIYCYRGSSKTLIRYFETIELQLEIDGDDFTQYDGATPKEVQEHHSERLSLFSFNLFTLKKTRLQLPPYEQRCVGIETPQSYRVRLHQLRVDFWRVTQLIIGLVLFLTAEKLGHNAMFYYITGIALGICCSFMLIIWFVGKMVPRRPMMYGFMVAGWTIGVYVIQLIWDNLQMILFTYRTYVFWYIVTTGILSFFFCYRIGPPKNKRSRNIIKWTLQLMSLLIVYLSSHFEEASVGIIVLTILYYYLPRAFLYKLYSFYLRRFPPKKRLLSSEEYYEEGVRETKKALEALRAYARSPDCKQWKVMCKLRDPLRFAEFVEGTYHLRDEEISEFENTKHSANNSNNYEDTEEMDTDNEGVDDNSEQSRVCRYTNGGRINPKHYRNIPINRHQYSAMRSYPQQNFQEVSDDNDDDYEDDGNEESVVKAPRQSYTPNSYLYNSSRSLVSNDSKVRRRSTSQNSGSGQCVISRSARMVSEAQKSGRRIDRQERYRSFEIQQNGDESD